MVRHSPFKDNLVIKRDRKGSVVRDPATGVPLRVQKMMLMCNPRVLHNHMIEHFDGSTDGNRVIILESKVREILKTSCSHVKKMSSREKLMCGCETCIIFEDMHECLNLFRKRYIGIVKIEINTMRDGRRKFDLSAKLESYMNQVCSDPNDHHLEPKYKSGWDAASALGCLPVTIDGKQYCKFACGLRECPECCDSWEGFIPTMERECTERISYVIFGTHSKCSYHGDGSMQVESKESICEQCETMLEERRAYLKGGIPKVKQVKLRIMLTEPLNEFLQQRGTYEKYLWKMKQHQMHVKLLGSKFRVRMCYHYFQNNDGVLVAEMDYSERYQPVPMRGIQSENFGKDTDVSIEIRIVSFQDADMSRRVVSYSHLSDEKPQIAATTFQNTNDMLNDLKERQEVIDDNYNMIIYITDGCAGQYKCGTALYLLTILAQNTGKVLYHFVKCAGHGKCRCDAEGGCHKTFCDTAFDKFVTVPERQMEGNRWAPSHRVEGGSIVSLARTVFNILQDDDYIRGARSHSRWKKKEERRIISER
jgi:hypothetical protein